MMWRRDRQEAVMLVEECEAFLAGTFAELCEYRLEPVPVWAWVNLLAHGTAGQLRVDAGQPAGPGRWHAARAFVAGEVLDLVEARRLSLRGVQAGALVPLELEVMSCPGAPYWQPGQLVARLLGVLPDQRGRVDHRGPTPR